MRKLINAIAEVTQRQEPWPGLPTIDPQALPCCTFVGLTLLTWYEVPLDDPAMGIGSGWWARMNIWQGQPRWSSVEAMARFGRPVDQLVQGCPHGAQIWGATKGHTVDVWDLPEGVLVFDSMTSRGYHEKLWSSWSAYLAYLADAWHGPVEARLVRLTPPGRG